MNTRHLIGAVMASIALACANSPPSSAGTGQPLTVKIGFVNVNKVKSTLPTLFVSERLKSVAESQLQQAVAQANDQITEARKTNKGEADIKKMLFELQLHITGRQAALSDLITQEQAVSFRTIAEAAKSVAQQKGLDFVVNEFEGVLIGTDKVVESGVDITDQVTKKLQSGQAASAKPAEASEPETKAAPAK